MLKPQEGHVLEFGEERLSRKVWPYWFPIDLREVLGVLITGFNAFYQLGWSKRAIRLVICYQVEETHVLSRLNLQVPEISLLSFSHRHCRELEE